MKSLYSILLSLLTLVLCCSCGEEDYTYPNVYTTFACLHTDGQGSGVLLRGDEGQSWHIADAYQPQGLVQDSVYRVISQFDQAPDTQSADSIIRPYTLLAAISSIPVPESDIEEMHIDPVSIQSIWKSGNYLNLILLVREKNKRHGLAFVENALEVSPDGQHKLVLTLFHDRRDDIEGFDRKYYLSVPLFPYQSLLQKGDTILFKINTYKEGMTSRTFTY